VNCGREIAEICLLILDPIGNRARPLLRGFLAAATQDLLLRSGRVGVLGHVDRAVKVALTTAVEALT
jgi:hypothetical protein